MSLPENAALNIYHGKCLKTANAQYMKGMKYSQRILESKSSK